MKNPLSLILVNISGLFLAMVIIISIGSFIRPVFNQNASFPNNINKQSTITVPSENIKHSTNGITKKTNILKQDESGYYISKRIEVGFILLGLCVLFMGFLFIKQILKNKKDKRELKKVKEQLKIAANFKEIFLKETTCDIETSLNAISDQIKRLYKPLRLQQNNEGLCGVKRTAKGLKSVIVDHLTFSQIKPEELIPEPNSVLSKESIQQETKEHEGEQDFFPLNGVKVLIADNEVINRHLIKIILQKNNMIVEEADGARDAIDLIGSHNYDLVLINPLLPNMSGLEAIKELKAMEIQVELLIMALLKKERPEDEKLCLLAGVNGILTSPFNEKELINKIVLVLKQKIGKEPLFYAQKVHEDYNSEGFYDLNELKKITRGDETFLKKIIELFIDHTPESVDKIKIATAQQDWEQVSMLAHKMRPSFAHMGVKDMAEKLKIIEDNAGERKNLDELPAMVNEFYKKTEKIIKKLEELIDYHPH
ncbi:MAG: response regulator [Bacteroidota bacterium]|nr:response regulator [Bacteroidota bacterium]